MALWHRIDEHPCVWFTKKDLPRLRANAQTDFWRPKFEAWRRELAGREIVLTTVLDARPQGEEGKRQ